MSIYSELKAMHDSLMYLKFPYHSVSVIHRSQDLGFHVIFMESVRHLVTDGITQYLDNYGFTYSFVSEKP